MKRIPLLCTAAILSLTVLTSCTEKPSVPSEDASPASPSLPPAASSVPDHLEVPPGLSPEEEAMQSQQEQMDSLVVRADYEEDVTLSDYDSFRETPTDYDQGVVFHASSPVKDFVFFVVEWGGEETGWGPMEGEVLWSQDELTPERDLLVVTSFPGDMPSRGISYQDESGHKSFTLSTSGLDGSLILSPIE